MHSNYPDSLKNLIIQAVMEVIESFGVPHFPKSEAECPAEIEGEWINIGVSSFTGPLMKGSVGIKCTHEFLYFTRLLETDTSKRDLRDWLCEMTNRIMGNLKGKFAMYGVDMEFGLPTAATGKELEVSSPRDIPFQKFTFGKKKLTFDLFFSAVMDESVSFDSEPDQEAVVGGLGDVIVF